MSYEEVCRNDGAEAELYDARNDPGPLRDLADEELGTIEKMFAEYVLKDGGGSLPAS